MHCCKEFDEFEYNSHLGISILQIENDRYLFEKRYSNERTFYINNCPFCGKELRYKERS